MHLFLSHAKSHTRKRRQHEFLTSEPRLRVYEFFSEVTPRVDNWINSKSEVTVTVLPREPTEIQVDNIWENSLQQDVAKTRHFFTALFAFLQSILFRHNPIPGLWERHSWLGRNGPCWSSWNSVWTYHYGFHNALGTPPLPLQFHIKEKKKLTWRSLSFLWW